MAVRMVCCTSDKHSDLAVDRKVRPRMREQCSDGVGADVAKDCPGLRVIAAVAGSVKWPGPWEQMPASAGVEES